MWVSYTDTEGTNPGASPITILPPLASENTPLLLGVDELIVLKKEQGHERGKEGRGGTCVGCGAREREAQWHGCPLYGYRPVQTQFL
jgi:hypothetical protein